jgi:hypothetical protein
MLINDVIFAMDQREVKGIKFDYNRFNLFFFWLSSLMTRNSTLKVDKWDDWGLNLGP